MKNAGKARSYGLYRHLRTSKEIIENLLNYYGEHHKSLQNFLILLHKVRFDLVGVLFTDDFYGGQDGNQI